MITEADLVPGALLSHAALAPSQVRMPGTVIAVVERLWERENDDPRIVTTWELYVLPLRSGAGIITIVVGIIDFFDMTRLA